MASRVHAYAVVILATLCSGYAFGARIRCGYSKSHGLFTADCSRRELYNVPQDLKNSTEVLDLSDNNIKRLYKASFIYYTSLQILYLSDNRIQFIEEGTFLPLTELQTLDLSSNTLRRLPYEMPSSLIRLYLTDNPIEEVNFTTANSLQFLSLAESRMETLPALVAMPSLVQLNLSETEILPTLTPDYLAPLCRLQVLHLPQGLLAQENQKCDCLTLKAWVQARQIKADRLFCAGEIENNPECNTTASPNAVKLYSDCLKEWDSMNMPYLAIVIGFSFFLTAILLGFFIWWSRRRRRTRTGKTPEKISKEPHSKEPSLLTS